MTTHLPALPTAELGRLGAIAPQELVLACLAFERAATAQTIARRLQPWGIVAAQVSGQLETLARTGFAEVAGARWLVTPAGEAEAGRRFDTDAAVNWPAFAEIQFPAVALRLDGRNALHRAYLSRARNLYAAVLAALFDVAEPEALPGLSSVRAALTWRIVAARCPDLLPAQAPGTPSGLSDALSRALYTGFCGRPGATLEQATPALLRRVLPRPVAAGPTGVRRALVCAALGTGGADCTTLAQAETGDRKTASSPVQADDAPEAFAARVAALARSLRTPKATGGAFSRGRVAIAQAYDAYVAENGAGMSLDDFKKRLWQAVRQGAQFHLTRLDIPHLMGDDLRQRSATPTRAGDVVHFIALDA